MTRSHRTAREAGTRAETAIVRYLQRVLGDDRIERRSKNGRNDRGDVSGLRAHGQRVVVEVKNTNRLELGTWVREAETERGNDDALVGMTWFKRRGTQDAGEWYVVMTGADLIALMTGERPDA